MLSKLGFCSRSQARALIKSGRVRVNGSPERNPERRVDADADRIEADGRPVRAEPRVYLVLNKPRGLVTTVSDEQGRETVMECLSPGDGAASGLPRVVPVGRLDKASEGLLLLTNDNAWAARITDPATHLDKVYHVQVDGHPDEATLRRMIHGVAADPDGDVLAAKSAAILRRGEKNSWLEVVLDEGKNRHIRRLAAALGWNVLRLVRVAIGPLQLGALAKGRWRHLTRSEVKSLGGPAPRDIRPGRRFAVAGKTSGANRNGQRL